MFFLFQVYGLMIIVLLVQMHYVQVLFEYVKSLLGKIMRGDFIQE
jgi:hypothetical protein